MSHKITKTDITVIVVVLVLSLISMVFLNTIIFADTGNMVEIEVDGKPYAEYDFVSLISPKTIEINTEYGYNILEISKNGVKVIDADCKDKLDVKQGIICRTNESIICLPHRLIIKIKGKSDVDVVTY